MSSVSGSRHLPRAELVALGTIVVGVGFLAWSWLTPLRSPPVPELRTFAREDGMPAAAMDARELGTFLAAHGIPPLSQTPPAMEAAVASSLEHALRELAASGSADAYGRLGQIFEALNMGEQSVACLALAVHRDPSSHRWRHLYGRALATQGDTEAAEEQYRRAIACAPGYLPTRWRLARVLMQEERLEEAERELRETIRLDDTSPHPWIELAALEVGRGRPERALPHVEQALRRDPESGRAHALASQVRAALGDREGAERHARRGRYSVKGLDAIPDPIVREGLAATDSVSFHRVTARALASAGRGAEAVALWERVVRCDPGNADDKVELANAYFSVGRRTEALRSVAAAIAQAPRGSRFRTARAQLAMRMGDPAGALRFADEALELEPASVVALGLRSLALASMDRTHEALAPAERALELAPHEPEVYSFLASLYVRVGWLDRAVATYRRGLAVDPDSRALRDGLAKVTAPPR